MAVFQDDILITEDTDETDIMHFREVHRRLDAEGFCPKREKCELMLPEVTSLVFALQLKGSKPLSTSASCTECSLTQKYVKTEVFSWSGQFLWGVLATPINIPVTIEQPSSKRFKFSRK